MGGAGAAGCLTTIGATFTGSLLLDVPTGTPISLFSRCENGAKCGHTNAPAAAPIMMRTAAANDPRITWARGDFDCMTFGFTCGPNGCDSCSTTSLSALVFM